MGDFDHDEENEMDLTELREILDSEYPEKLIVDIVNFEDESHQTYRHLYEGVQEQISSLQEENATLTYKYQQREKELIAAEKEIAELKKKNSVLAESLIPKMDKMKQFMGANIFVSNVIADSGQEQQKAFNIEEFCKTISDQPGVYGGYRPSWFTPLQTTLSKNEISQKNKRKSNETLLKKIQFWKKHGDKVSTSPEKVAVAYDKNRKNDIIELLHSDCSNEEKYLKYYLMTPGLDKEYLKTLVGASELNIDARLVIALLEQPNDKFNKTIIENYVSRLHKGTEYNLKQELAEELIQGKWNIKANVNGTEELFQLVPMETLTNLLEKIDSICAFLDSNANDGLSANLAESPSNPGETENPEQTTSVSENESESEVASFVSFKEDMI